MLGRARVKRICQAALGALIDPKKAAYDLVKDETGELFDRWFPDTSTPQQRLLKAVLRDVSKAYPDQALSEHLTEKAQALLAMHGLSREELAGPGIRLDAQRAVERVCARGLKTAPPGLHEADRSFDGGLPPIEIEASIEQPLRQLLWSFYDSLIKNLDEELQVAIFGRTLDLLEGIDRKLDGLTPSAEPPAPPNSIPEPVADFIGYADEIAAVKAALSGGGAVAVSAVQGMGGVGKSQLTYKVAAELAADFPDGRVFVEMLGTTAQARTAADAMTSVLGAFGVKDVLPDDREAEYRRLLAGKRVLILLDNVATRAGLDRLTPPRPSALLVTSRVALALDGVPAVALERLSRVAAKALLGSILPSLKDASRDALAEFCADLPLALRVAGTYLKATRYPVDAYLEELAEQQLARLAESGRDLGDDTLNPEIVLGHSYDLLAEAEPELARTFTLLGVFPADFDLRGAVAVLDGEARTVRRQLGRLVERGLLQTPEEDRYRLHDLLRELANARGDDPARDAAAARHCGHYLSLLDWAEGEVIGRGDAYRAALDGFERELANVQAAAMAAENAAPAHGRLGSLLDTLGRREEALTATEEAVAVYRELAAARPDVFRPELATALNNLGIMLDALGQREAALAATEEAVTLYRELAAARPDAFRPDLARGLNNLGSDLGSLGQREDALAATEEAVALYRELAAALPDAFGPELAGTLSNLGNRLDALGQREDALAATEEAVAVHRELAAERPDAVRPELAMALNNLGALLAALGRREDALAATEEAIVIYRDLAAARPAAFRPDLAMTLTNLGNWLDALGRHKDALVAAEEAVAIYRELAAARPDAFRPDLASSLNSLGALLAAVGRREDALAATEDAVAVYRELAAARPEVFNSVHSTSLYNLSLRLDALHQPETAQTSNIEAIKLLAPTFLLLPYAVIQWITPMCQLYVERCEKLGIEPDAELLGPIIAVFEKLESASS